MPSENTVHAAIELAVSSWLVAARLPGAEKVRLHRIEGGDTAALLALIAELRSSASRKLGGGAEVACCFEAGRDGFWLQRLLAAHGIAAHVLEPTSVLVNRRARRAKTDRLDAEGMLRVLAAWLGGDRQVCSMVRVPTPEEEDAKRPLVQCAWAAARKRGGYLQAQFQRLRARRGPKKAICAVAASILTAAYHMLRDGTFYQDLGPDHFSRRARSDRTARLVSRLTALGYTVQPPPECAGA